MLHRGQYVTQMMRPPMMGIMVTEDEDTNKLTDQAALTAMRSAADQIQGTRGVHTLSNTHDLWVSLCVEMLDMEESSVERERRLGKVERTVKNMAATAEWGKHIAAAKRHAAEAAAAPPQPAASIEESSAKAHSIEQTHIEKTTPVGEKKSAVLSSALPFNAVSRIGDPLKVWMMHECSVCVSRSMLCVCVCVRLLLVSGWHFLTICPATDARRVGRDTLAGHDAGTPGSHTDNHSLYM